MAKVEQLTAFFLSYRSYLRKLVSKIVKDGDIDDIVQETYLKTYEADLKKEIKYVRSYMVATARNLALNNESKWDNKRNDSLEDFSELPVELNSINLEDDVATKERFYLFCQATEQLPSSVRKCFILKKVYGMSQKEIAQYMKLSESTVEKHIAKGLLLSVQYMQSVEKQSSASKSENSGEATAVSKINEQR